MLWSNGGHVNTSLPFLIALIILTMGASVPARPSPTATLASVAPPAPPEARVPSPTKDTTAPLTDAQVRARFTASEKARLAAPAGSKEHAEAAGKAAVMALVLALDALQDYANAATPVAADRYLAEASQWMVRHTEREEEVYRSARTQQEQQLKEMEAQRQQLEASIATAGDLRVEQYARSVLFKSMQLISLHLQEMYQLAFHHRDPSAMLAYAQRIQAIDQEERAVADRLFTAVLPEAANLHHRLVIQEAGDIGLLASAYLLLGRLSDAESTYHKALDLQRTLPDDTPNPFIAETMIDLAHVSLTAGDTDSARVWYEKASQAIEATANQLRRRPAAPPLPGDTPPLDEQLVLKGRFQVRIELANVAALESNYDEALDWCNQALALPLDGLDRLTCLETRMTDRAFAGDIDPVLGDFDKLLRLRRDLVARAASDEIFHMVCSPEQMATNYWFFAIREREQGQRERALRFAEESRLLNEGIQFSGGASNSYMLLATLYREQGNLPKARASAEKALAQAREQKDPGLVASALRIRAEIYLREGQPNAAMHCLQLAEETFGTTVPPAEQVNLLDLRGRIREVQGDRAAALTDYRTAVERLEAIRLAVPTPSGFAALVDNEQIYDHIVALLVRTGQGEQAFNYVQRARARKIQEAVRLFSIRTHNQVLQDLLVEYRRLLRHEHGLQVQLQTPGEPGSQNPSRLGPLQEDLTTTRKQIEETRRKIHALNPNAERILSITPATLSELQPYLPADAVLIQYAPMSDGLYAFCVSRDRLHVFPLRGNTGKLRKQIEPFLKVVKELRTDYQRDKDALAGATPSAHHAMVQFENLLVALHRQLIAPIEGELTGKRLLLVVPMDELYYVPFAALAKRTGSGLHFLVEEKQVVTLAAANVADVAKPRDAGAWGTGILAVGGVSRDLIESEREARDVARLFPSASLLLGEQATRSALLAPEHRQKRYWLLATHGTLNADDPLDSSIPLASGIHSGSEKLTLGEILSLPLEKVELVALSSCDSARGEKLPEGTEVMSLAQVFCGCCGAAATIAPLWEVPDEAAKEFMVPFFRAIAAGCSKGEAMQRAQLQLLHHPRYRHPFFWAPYLLMGDWR